MLKLLNVPRRMLATMCFVVALIGAAAVIAPSSASAIPPRCPIGDDGCPLPPRPKPPTTRTELLAEATNSDHYKAEHHEATARLYVTRRISDNVPLRVYVSTTVHGWDDNWFDGFVSVSQVRVNVDGYLAASTGLHKLTICGYMDPAGCNDRTETWTEDVPLSLVNFPRESLGLAIDLHREG